MFRVLYYFRTFFISFEALIILGLIYVVSIEQGQLKFIVSSISINDEMMKYLMLLPLGVATWIINELRQLVFEDEETAKLLIKWPDYWMLKCHIWVSVLYSFIFTILSVFPWLQKSGVTTGTGMALFIFGMTGQLIVAVSIYFARFSIREITIHAK